MPAKKASGPSAKKARKAQQAAGEKDLLVALRQFIRTKGADYLRDPNISSIGIGYKVTDGRRTPELSVQFTVNEKHSAPEVLEALGTTPLPESITVDGVEVPTDVLERRYEPGFRVVAEPVPVDRKVRLDPIVPGVSVGNVHVRAGTIGGVVYDRADGTPYVLSNWHVLHGSNGGALGDDVVQPGPHDDNRIERNRLGRLRLGISVTDASRRNPAVTAQAAATLHLLTRGRAILGIGVGEREGNEPYGVDWTNQLRGLRKPSRPFARCGIHAVL